MPTNNLEQASRASRLSSLDSLGSEKFDYDVEGGLSVLEQLAGDFIKRVQANLKSQDMIVTGEIADISTRHIDGGIEITANPQLIFQDAGVNGSRVKLYDTPFSYKTKRPPIEPILEWIKRKNSNTVNNKPYSGKETQFKESDKESMAYAISEKIFQRGMAPTNVYSKEIPKLIEDVSEGLADFFVHQVIKNL